MYGGLRFANPPNEKGSIDATKWQGAMLIQFGGLRYVNPPYEGVEIGCIRRFTASL
jgi:hypothetical protein